MKPDRKIVLPIFILLAIILAYLLFLRKPSAVKVTVKVVQGDLTSTVSAPGIVGTDRSSDIFLYKWYRSTIDGKEGRRSKGRSVAANDPSSFGHRYAGRRLVWRWLRQTLNRLALSETGRTTIQIKFDLKTEYNPGPITS